MSRSTECVSNKDAETQILKGSDLLPVDSPLKGGWWVGRCRGAGQVQQLSGLVELFPELVQASGNLTAGNDGIRTRSG